MTIRDNTLRIGFMFVFLLIAARLVQVMVFEHRQYNVLAQQQHVVEKELAAKRGEIYTADGYPLVLNEDVYLVFGVPLEMDDVEKSVEKLRDFSLQKIEETAGALGDLHSLQGDEIKEKLASIEQVKLPIEFDVLGINYHNSEEEEKYKLVEEQIENWLREDLSQMDNQFVQVFKRVDETTKKEIEALSLRGLYFQVENKRSYPEGEMAAHVLGFVGKDEAGTDQGYFGLEGFYDRDLSGRAGYEVLERDVIGQKIPFGLSKVRKASDGRDLILTIERELQYVIENKLIAAVEKYKAKSGTAILLDPDTGAILAMTNAPSYAPEYWPLYLFEESDVSKIDAYQNYAVSSNYEPGSVMKPMTIAAALNEGVVTQDTIFHDGGAVEYSGYKVRTWDDSYHGDIDIARVLQLSNNTGAAWVGHRLGFERFGMYVDRYNFGERTGIDLEGEEAGIVRAKREWRDIDLANMSFGQGISLTPIQLVTVFSSLVNGGDLYDPYIVRYLVDQTDGDSLVIDRQPHKRATMVSAEVSEEIRQMLGSVVTKGEFRWFVDKAGMDKYSIGGKTGTAQIPVDGRYDPHRTNTTFVGFGPVADPAFVLLVRLNQPGTSTYSADTAVPLWMDIARELMVHYEIKPIR